MDLKWLLIAFNLYQFHLSFQQLQNYFKRQKIYSEFIQKLLKSLYILEDVHLRLEKDIEVFLPKFQIGGLHSQLYFKFVARLRLTRFNSASTDKVLKVSWSLELQSKMSQVEYQVLNEHLNSRDCLW